MLHGRANAVKFAVQYHLMVDWQIAERQADSELTLAIAGRLKEKYTIQSLSVDKGFSDMADKAELENWIPQVIMFRKGKRNQAEKTIESAQAFKTLKNKHSAVESNINELEHRGLDRCPDRTQDNFKRYEGLAITAYNSTRSAGSCYANGAGKHSAKMRPDPSQSPKLSTYPQFSWERSVWNWEK